MVVESTLQNVGKPPRRIKDVQNSKQLSGKIKTNTQSQPASFTKVLYQKSGGSNTDLTTALGNMADKLAPCAESAVPVYLHCDSYLQLLSSAIPKRQASIFPNPILHLSRPPRPPNNTQRTVKQRATRHNNQTSPNGKSVFHHAHHRHSIHCHQRHYRHQ